MGDDDGADADDTLARLLRDAVDGRPPPADGTVTVLPQPPGKAAAILAFTADGTVTVLPQPPGKAAAILAFTAHHVVAADVDAAWVHEQLPPGDLGAPMAAPFVGALTTRLGVAPSSLDVVFAGIGTGRGAGGLLRPTTDLDHPRTTRSERYRTDTVTFATADDAGVVIIGRGLADRWESAFEVDEAARGRGLGRRLAAAALDLVPSGEPLFVAIAPGNVPSLKAVLATGAYTIIGGELLFAVGSDG